MLAIAGGLAFWLANFAISRSPIAAEYRAALSISYFPMLLESLIGGLIIGFCFALGLAIRNEPNGETTLSGLISDQSALFGVLNKIQALHLVLISINRISP